MARTAAVAEAIEGPLQAALRRRRALPRGKVGVIVALADKVEALAGLFGIGQLPTGDKDPFAPAPPCARRDSHARRGAGTDRPRAARRSGRACVRCGDPGFRVSPCSHSSTTGCWQPARAGLQRAGGRRRPVSAPPAQLADLKERLAAVRAFAALPEAASLAAAKQAGRQHPEEVERRGVPARAQRPPRRAGGSRRCTPRCSRSSPWRRRVRPARLRAR